MTQTAVRCPSFKNFWAKFSHRCDNSTMMLNHSADEFEHEEREYIVSCLPDLRDKVVVDIGAGIGRFTTEFARDARHVLSSDFIESFVDKNRERNGHFSNVSYRVADALHLDIDPQTVDVVFTNWLLMYLQDKEVIHFLNNVLCWLQPDGYVHLRESCSQPSTASRAGTTMHNASDVNPTSYRLSSVYIKLLKSIRYRDHKGTLYRFAVHWAQSVPTYIMRQHNWRQVHWLAQKVVCEDDVEPSPERLLSDFSTSWNLEQVEWDRLLDDEQAGWTGEVLGRALMEEPLDDTTAVLAYNPRKTAFHVHVDAHALAKTNETFFRTSLTKANREMDDRVRFAWNDSLQEAVQYWGRSESLFDAFVATELFTDLTQNTLDELSSILKADSPLILLEPFDEGQFDAGRIEKMLSRFHKVDIDDVTDVCNTAISKYLRERQPDGEVPSKVWKLIRARV